MFSILRWPGLLVTLLLFAIACGGSDDEAESEASDSKSDGAGKANPAGGAAKKNKNETIPEVKDGVFAKGTLRVDVTGDKRFTLTSDEGNGFASGGNLVVNYGSAEWSTILSFVSDKSGDDGGMAVSTKELATAGTWSDDCDVSVEVGADKVSGDFECKDIQAVGPGTAKTYKVTVKGKFSVTR